MAMLLLLRALQLARQAAVVDTLTDKLAAARSHSRRTSAAGADEAEARLRAALAAAKLEAGGCLPVLPAPVHVALSCCSSCSLARPAG